MARFMSQSGLSFKPVVPLYRILWSGQATNVSHVLWILSHSCSIPAHLVERDVLTTTSHDDGPEDPIDLSKLATLRRFSVSLRVLYDAETIQTPFLWLNRVLRSSYSTSANQQLEDILIRLYVSFTHPVVLDILHWKAIFDTLLEDNFQNLRNLKIFVDGHPEHGDMVVELLENSVDVKRLRARRNLVVDIRGKHTISIIRHILVSEGLFLANARLQRAVICSRCPLG